MNYATLSVDARNKSATSKPVSLATNSKCSPWGWRLPLIHREIVASVTPHAFAASARLRPDRSK
jgi:hypothetical protein